LKIKEKVTQYGIYIKFEAKFLKTGISRFMTKQSSHGSSLHLLSMRDSTCGKGLWSAKPSFRAQFRTSQPHTSDTNSQGETT